MNKLKLNVTLQPCNIFDDENLFTDHPALRKIWSAEHMPLVIESYKVWLHEFNDTGNFYKIKVDDDVVGVTGYWMINTVDAGLRWHGVIPSAMRHGIGRIALELLIKRLPPHVVYLHEIALTTNPIKFFLQAGFKENVDAETVATVLKSSGSDKCHKVLTYEV